MSGGLTPRGEETLVRLASWMPFEQARELLQDLVGIQVSKATVRRATLTTGEGALAVCEGEVERLKQECAIEARLRQLQVCNTTGIDVDKAASYLLPKGMRGR